MVTLSLVITGWGGKSTTCSFREMFLAIRSMNGILKCRPTPHTPWKAPSRSMTKARDWGTTRILAARMARTSRIRMTGMIILIMCSSIVIPPVLSYDGGIMGIAEYGGTQGKEVGQRRKPPDGTGSTRTLTPWIWVMRTSWPAGITAPSPALRALHTCPAMFTRP